MNIGDKTIMWITMDFVNEDGLASNAIYLPDVPKGDCEIISYVLLQISWCHC